MQTPGKPRRNCHSASGIFSKLGVPEVRVGLFLVLTIVNGGPELLTVVVRLVVYHVAGLGHNVPHVTSSAATSPQFDPRAH